MLDHITLSRDDGTTIPVIVSWHFSQRYAERFLVSREEINARLRAVLPGCKVAPRGIKVDADEGLPPGLRETLVLWSRDGELFIMACDQNGVLSLITVYQSSRSQWFARALRDYGRPSEWESASAFLGLTAPEETKKEEPKAIRFDRKAGRPRREKSSLRSIMSGAVDPDDDEYHSSFQRVG